VEEREREFEMFIGRSDASKLEPAASERWPQGRGRTESSAGRDAAGVAAEASRT
jgi:hypothetical protein